LKIVVLFPYFTNAARKKRNAARVIRRATGVKNVLKDKDRKLWMPNPEDHKIF
jgi:hypothetical protein